jgi:diacylglycerol kinase (ATP)
MHDVAARAYLIANPTSGTDRAVEMIPQISSRLRSLFDDLIVNVTESGDDLLDAGARAVEDRCAAVYVAGGDGTVNGVLRGMMQRDPIVSIPIGIIPCGTGNDFARTLGLGEEPEVALERLLDPHVLAVDVGLMNDRPFLNASAGGFIAETSGTVTPALKDVAGRLAYLIGGAKALFTTEPLRARVLVSSPRDPGAGIGRTPSDRGTGVPNPYEVSPAYDLQMFAVCNAPFIGGGYAIAPEALIDDGLVDVLVVPRMPLVEFLAMLKRIAASTPSESHVFNSEFTNVLHFRTSAFELEFERVARVNVDGEVLEANRCAYRLRSPGAAFFCGPHPLASSRPTTLADWQRGHQYVDRACGP